MPPWLMYLLATGVVIALRIGAVALARGSLEVQSVAPARHASPTLIAEITGVQPGQPLTVAIQFDIEPHWHLYWINPGDAGLAPRLDWRLPAGFEVGELRWPTPRFLRVGPLTTYGFEGELTLLAEIRPPATLEVGPDAELAVRLKWLVCREECVAEEGEVAVRLPVVRRAEPDSQHAARFAAARQRLPQPAAGALRIVSQDARSITLEFPESVGATLPASARVFVEDVDIVEPAGRQERVAGSARRVLLAKTDRAPATVQEITVVLVLDPDEKPLPRAYRLSTRAVNERSDE